MARKLPKRPRPKPHQFRDDIVFMDRNGRVAVPLGITLGEDKGGAGRRSSSENADRLRDALRVQAWVFAENLRRLAELHPAGPEPGFDPWNAIAEIIGDEAVTTSARWGRDTRTFRELYGFPSPKAYSRFAREIAMPSLLKLREGAPFNDLASDYFERLRILRRGLRCAEDQDDIWKAKQAEVKVAMKSGESVRASVAELQGRIGFPGMVGAIQLAVDANIQPDSLWLDQHFAAPYFTIARLVGSLIRYQMVKINRSMALAIYACLRGIGIGLLGRTLPPEADYLLRLYSEDLFNQNRLEKDLGSPWEPGATLLVVRKEWHAVQSRLGNEAAIRAFEA